MNVVIFLLWFGMICVPQFSYQSQFETKSVSNITCLTQSLSNISCSNESSNRLNTVVYLLPSGCDAVSMDTITIRDCDFNEDNVAVAESDSSQVVTSTLLDGACMVVDQGDVFFDAVLANVTIYTVCIGVSARVIWYQYILDFISGTGFFNETLLFQGVYPKNTIGGYDLSLAFLFMTALIYTLGVLLLVYK